MKGLSGPAKALVALLVAYIVADILLTPLAGLETRNPSLVTPLGFVGLGLLFAGLALAIVAVVLLFRGSRRAAGTAVIAAVLYFPAAITEWTGHFSQLRPPSAIATIELVQALFAALVIVLGIWVTRVRATT